MSDPYDIYGELIEFRCGFGRVFTHVNLAPKHKDRARIDAVAAAIQDLIAQPEDGETQVLPIGYTLKVKDRKRKKHTLCDRIKVCFRHLQEIPEEIIAKKFPHQKGATLPSDVFMVRLSFLAKK